MCFGRWGIRRIAVKNSKCSSQLRGKFHSKTSGQEEKEEASEGSRQDAWLGLIFGLAAYVQEECAKLGVVELVQAICYAWIQKGQEALKDLNQFLLRHVLRLIEERGSKTITCEG